MILTQTVIYCVALVWLLPVGRGLESCLSAFVRVFFEQQLFECVLRLRWSFYSVFPWMSLSLEYLGEWFAGLTRRHRRDNRRCWGYERLPSHPYLNRCLDYGYQTRCRFRLVSFLCFFLGVCRSERPARSAHTATRVNEGILSNPNHLYGDLSFNFHFLKIR